MKVDYSRRILPFYVYTEAEIWNNLVPGIYVVVNFLSQLIFIFPLFWGMVMYANEF